MESEDTQGTQAIAAMTDAARVALLETARSCFDRVVEVDKVRINVNLALAVTTVSLTGFAFQNAQPKLFFLAACVPIFCLTIDLIVKTAYVTPFLYRAFVADYRATGSDSEILTFLQFLGREPSPYVRALQLASEHERRRRFRVLYLRRWLILRVIVFATAAIVEVALGLR